MTHIDLPVAVIGGGPTGLAAAAYLARTGASVAVFEKSSALGGRSATADRQGYLFNRGAHALYTGGAASRALRDLGVTYTYAIPKDVLVLHAGRAHPLPITPAALLRSTLLDLGDKLGLLRLFGSLPRLDPRPLAHISIAQWLDEQAPRPMLRRLLESFARTFAYSSALDLVSADLFISRLQSTAKYPVHYIEGGWQTLVDGLERAAAQAGARITRGAPVVGVEREGDRAVGVRLRDGRLVQAQAVVVATPPADAARLLPSLAEALRDRLPAEVACLDVALRRLPVPSRPVAQDLDGPRFVTAQSRYVRVAPPGGGLVHVFKQLDPRRATDPRQDQQELEAVLDAAQPGWREHLLDHVFLPRMQASGALPTAATGGLAGRPGPHVPGLANVVLAGDWVGPEGFLLDAALASAGEAARLAGGWCVALQPAA